MSCRHGPSNVVGPSYLQVWLLKNFLETTPRMNLEVMMRSPGRVSGKDWLVGKKMDAANSVCRKGF